MARVAADSGADNERLLSMVQALRSTVSDTTFPLDLPSAATARLERTRLLNQLDDYVVPRLTSLDAPLLAVVGGSTGAGKSTLVNSVVGREVTLPGVLRPTTRSPVLIHHPSDAAWFSGSRVLPGLARITGRHSSSDGPGAVRLVSTDEVAPGLALIDAPDIDSVVEANRELATQLLAAADLWVFVTTAARYADAVPWELLREASERGTAVAVVLDRVPPQAVDEIRTHFASMLREQGLEPGADLHGGRVRARGRAPACRPDRAPARLARGARRRRPGPRRRRAPDASGRARLARRPDPVAGRGLGGADRGRSGARRRGPAAYAEATATCTRG